MTSQALHEAMRSVSDTDELAEFILALKSDLLANPDQWTNADLTSALDAMAAWIRDMERCKRQRGESLATLNTFRFCAEVLYASKVYE